MNSFKGKIADIKTNGSLSLITIQVESVLFTTIVIETPDTASYLKQGNSVTIIFKETEVIISKGIDQPSISIQNKTVGEILDIKKGALLSTLTIDTTIGKIIAVVTSDSIDQLQLYVGEKITTMIKATEIMLSK